ncbi:serine/threonine protein kinase [Ktedonobacteria bacterium brp13]|nr:serine/threonine protein kinase [Ktedonobacteria bacterium brp13]
MSTAPRRLGKYELLQPLGRGHVGEVWKARDVAQKKDVAIKILHSDLQADPRFLDRFANTGQALITLRQDNLVSIYDAVITRPEQARETTVYLAMDLINGYTLTNYLQASSNRGIFPPIAEIAYLFRKLGTTIDYLHMNGIVHGDIKPNNILLDQERRGQFKAGEPLLMDVSMTLIAGNDSQMSAPHYIAPEQAQGQETNSSSDIYSLGILLYELCTGVVPFRGENSYAVIAQQINALPAPPMLINANIPPALSGVILRALAKDTGTRFQSGTALANAIAEACSLQIPGFSLEFNEQRQIPGFAYPTNAPLQTQQSILGVPQPLTPANPAYMRPIPTRPSQPLSQSHPGFPLGDPMKQGIGAPPQQSQPLPPLPQTLQDEEPTLKNEEKQGRQSSEASDQQYSGAPAYSADATHTTQQSGGGYQYQQQQPSMPGYGQQYQQQQPSMSGQPYPQQQNPPLNNPTHLQAPASTSLSSTKKVVLGLVALVVILAAIFGITQLNKGGTSNPPQSSTQTAVADNAPGTVFFQDSPLGHDDQLRIVMNTIAPPPNGQDYYAWLQTNQQTTLLGKLTVQDQQALYSYAGNAQHSNLLATMQGVLITSENAGTAPQSPGKQIVYSGTFNGPVLKALRTVLYQTPDLPDNPAVANSMFETIKSLNDKASSIVDSVQNTGDTGLATRQATRVIEMIDGTGYAMSSGHLPKGIPSQSNLKIGLLSSPNQPGYIDIFDKHLDEIKALAGNNASLLTRIQNTKNALADLRTWTQQMEQYDTQLLATAQQNPAGLRSQNMINIALQLKQDATDSYTGRTVPPDTSPTSKPGSGGAQQAYTEAQYMAALDLNKTK